MINKKKGGGASGTFKLEKNVMHWLQESFTRG